MNAIIVCSQVIILVEHPLYRSKFSIILIYSARTSYTSPSSPKKSSNVWRRWSEKGGRMWKILIKIDDSYNEEIVQY